MNGVEAAASLFGSEESDSDLFATLGDTAPNPFSPTNLFSLDEPSSPHKSDLSSDAQFYSQPDTSTFEEYAPNYLSSGDNEQVQSHNGYPGHWNEQVQKNIDDVTYSNEVSPSLDPPPAEVSNQSYAPRPSLPQKNDNYIPSAIPATMNPVTTPSYSPYMPSNPPPPTRIVQDSLTQPYNLQHTLPAMTQYPGTTLPMTPPRPKYSNAYDPPFIPSSSRRTGRTGGAQQNNSYQQPSSPYIPATGVSHASKNHPSQTTPYYAENNDTLSQMPSNQNHPAQPTYNNNLDSAAVNYSGDIPLRSQRGTTSYPSEHLDTAPDPVREEPYTYYSLPSHGAIDPSSSLQISPPYQELGQTEVSNPTPSSISASPPVSQYDVGSSAQTDSLNGHVSQPMLSHKREVTAGAKDNYDPYAPKVNHGSTNYIPRTSSPLSGFNRTQNESKKPSNTPSILSGQSSVSSIGASPAVPIHASRSLSIANDEYTSRHTSQRLDLKVGLQDTMRSSNPQYAPSPSLLGSNDPLARTSARAPVVTFGFGGKMVTCFHGMPGLNAGFDVALSSRTSSELKVHILHKLLPAMNSPSSSYPGPLLCDPATPSLSLVRPSLSAQTKAKKAAIIGYLSSRTHEIDQGLGYLSNLEKRAAQGTLVLVKLLKIMVENDGRLLGTYVTFFRHG
jgi:COPII coat assembly protein SEC16